MVKVVLTHIDTTGIVLCGRNCSQGAAVSFSGGCVLSKGENRRLTRAKKIKQSGKKEPPLSRYTMKRLSQAALALPAAEEKVCPVSTVAIRPTASAEPMRSRAQRGVILGFVENRGFGFIRPVDEGADTKIFFHISNVQGQATGLCAGLGVAYNVLGTERGPTAIEVVLLTP